VYKRTLLKKSLKDPINILLAFLFFLRLNDSLPKIADFHYFFQPVFLSSLSLPASIQSDVFLYYYHKASAAYNYSKEFLIFYF